VPQPALEGGAVASAANASAAPVADAAANNTTAGGATRDARLEIVPPDASRATRAGTQSGIQSGGEGDMLRQELQTTQETVAAREAEVRELKSRIAELEQLQQKQQQLITMKDSELAASQQRLAKSNDQAESAQSGAALPWAIGGGALLLALLGGWWWGRRPTRPVFRAPAEGAAATPSISDAFAPGQGMAMGDDVEPSDEPVGEAIDEAVVEAHAPAEPAFALTPQPAPPTRPAASPTPSAPIAPAWHIAASGDGRRAYVEPTLATQPGQERLELARAYIDLGDRESARQLLSEVIINGDLAARQAASRMLQDMG